MLFDTHTHIYLPEFDNDREAVVQRAKEKGVSRLMLPNVDVSTVEALRRTLTAYPDFCTAAMGLHPTSVGAQWRDDLDRIFAELESGPYIAVGEIGLDLYWDDTYRNEQIEVFEAQVERATRLGLPLILHCRNATSLLLERLRRLAPLGLRGVFHCFSGTADDLPSLFDVGEFYIGIGGVATFKKSNLPESLPTIPTDRLLLETDAPYLAPVPHRGQRNEPAFLRDTAERVAEMIHRPVIELEEITYRNACRLFSLDPDAPLVPTEKESPNY